MWKEFILMYMMFILGLVTYATAGTIVHALHTWCSQ